MLSKKEMQKRWANGESYNAYISGELNSFRKNAWKKTILSHFPTGLSLKILDVGMGPGFFACILSEEGHKVTGIDQSEGMLSCARANAANLGVAPDFIHMDIDELNFEDESFDVVISRNVTWTLQHLQKIYAEFKRMLKPGGMLLIYDANWHMHYFDDEMMRRVREREQAFFKKYGREEVVCNNDTDYFMQLPLSGVYRPNWDKKVLLRLGFEVSADEDMGRKVYEEWEKELYGESPFFEICAIKKDIDKNTLRVKKYWQKRSYSFGFDMSDESMDKWKTIVSDYLPEGKLNILDMGTGTGFIACIAAMGHRVTGVDISSNMIGKAKENARSLNLEVDFICTEAGRVPFENESFDVVISRNLLWALSEPEEIIREWHRLLKPDGTLIYFDGNHYYYLFNDEDMRNRLLYEKINGSLHGRGDEKDGPIYKEMDDVAIDLPLSKYNRPFEWDDIILPKLGFEIINEDINRPQDKLKEGKAEGYYTHFVIAAQKQ